jgi:hypothetical protein
MSLCVVQSSGEAVLGAMSVPWTASYRAEISADLPVSVLMTVEISLCCFGGSTARKFASVWQDMSINVTAGLEIC